MDIWGLLGSGYSLKQCLSLHVKQAPFSLWLVDEEIYLRQIRGTASTRITAGPSGSSSPACLPAFLRNLDCTISTASESHAWQYSMLLGQCPKDTCLPLPAKGIFQASSASLWFVSCVHVSFSDFFLTVYMESLSFLTLSSSKALQCHVYIVLSYIPLHFV